MACPDENTLVAFASGSLSMADASLVDEHLDTCPTCFALVAELARTAPEDAEPTRLVPIQAEPEPADPSGTQTVVVALKQPPPPPPEPPPPSQIGRHTLLHRIGADAIGVIYIAHDRELDRRVALKLIGTPKNPSDADERARIVREARLLVTLRHPNVVEVYDAGEHEDQLYVATELVEGEPLDRWMLRPRKSWLDRLGMFVQAGHGLAAAHAAGIVHRDFRPANVIVDLEGRVRVTDFGFARPLPTPQEDKTVIAPPPPDPSSLHSIHQPVARSGILVGTPAYMAPETYEGRGDARVDQYAFCIALYEALYRRRPFDANDPETLRLMVSAGAISPIPTTTEVPSWLGGIVMRGLSRAPDRRFPDMFALLAAIDFGLARRRKRRVAALAGVAALAAVGLVAGVATAFRREPCVAAEERLKGVWDAPRRAAAAEAVRASGLPYADQSWSNASRLLDARALAWAQLHEQVCTDARDRGTAIVEDPRSACLERRLIELRAMADVLVKADTRAVERAYRVAGEWPAVRTCAEAGEAAARDMPISDVHTAIAHAHVLTLAGRLDDAAPLVDRVRTGATRRSLQGEGALLAGELELARGRTSAAADAFGDAMTAAVAADDARALATAAIEHARTCFALDQIDRGLHSVALGRAAIERLGPQRELEADLFAIDGRLQLAAGRIDEGRTASQRALDLAEDELAKADALDGLALAATAAGDADGAEQALQRALAIRETELGKQHPESARTLAAWSAAATAAGRDAQALDLAARALAIDELVLGVEDPRTIATRVIVGRTHEQLGHHRDALAELRRVVEIGTRVLGADHATVVDAREELARVHQAERAWGAALVEIEQVLAIRRRTLGDRDPRVGLALVRLAEIRRGEGRRDLARVAAAQALALLAPASHPDAVHRAQAMLGEAEPPISLEVPTPKPAG